MAKLIVSLKHFRQHSKLVRTPSVVSLLIMMGLLGIVLVVPDAPKLQPAHAAPISLKQGSPTKSISLRDRLVAGLKARLPSEVKFVDDVVDAVNEGRLPQRLVDETFFWSRDRANIRSQRGRIRRPIIYFRPAMVARTKRIGVTI